MGNVVHKDPAGICIDEAEWQTAGLHIDSQGNPAKLSRSATLVVAASNASANSKAGADYVCGDGTYSTDDQYIQAAIDALPTLGGKVVLSDGTFVLARGTNYYGDEWGSINPTKPVWIQGQGRGKTILKVGNGVYTNAIGSRMIADIQIEDLTIDGNSTNCPNQGVDGNQNGIYTGSYLGVLPNHLIYRNLEIKNCARIGIYVGANSYDVFLENIQAHNNGQEGIGLDQTYGAIVINPDCQRNNLLQESGRGGLVASTDVMKTFGVTIIGGHFKDNAYSGITINTARGITIINPWVEDSGVTDAYGGFGIYVLNSENVNIYSPIISESLLDGIAIESSNHTNIFGGSSRNNQRHGINLAIATYCVITGIRAYDDQTPKTQLYGINEGAGCDYNTFKDNDLNGNDTGETTLTGSNTKVSGNMGYVTENSGTATVASGQTHIDVAHGLTTTPTRVLVTPTSLEAVTHWWVSGKGATEFIINVDQDPAAAGGAIFDWFAQVGEG